MTDGPDRTDSVGDRSADDLSRADGGVDVAAPERGGRGTGGTWRGLDGLLAWVGGVCEAHAYRWVQLSFGFVFFYFGLQKWPVVQGASPVRPPVRAFVEAVGFGGWIPFAPETGLLLIGVYETTLGVLWFATAVEERRFGTSRLFVVVALMTLAHQVVTLFPLVLVPGVAFRQTDLWVPLAGTVPLPVALDWLSAFILKNLLFFGAFFYYYAEWAERYDVGAQARAPGE